MEMFTLSQRACHTVGGCVPLGDWLRMHGPTQRQDELVAQLQGRAVLSDVVQDVSRFEGMYSGFSRGAFLCTSESVLPLLLVEVLRMCIGLRVPLCVALVRELHLDTTTSVAGVFPTYKRREAVSVWFVEKNARVRVCRTLAVTPDVDGDIACLYV